MAALLSRHALLLAIFWYAGVHEQEPRFRQCGGKVEALDVGLGVESAAQIGACRVPLVGLSFACSFVRAGLEVQATSSSPRYQLFQRCFLPSAPAHHVTDRASFSPATLQQERLLLILNLPASSSPPPFLHITLPHTFASYILRYDVPDTILVSVSATFRQYSNCNSQPPQ